MNYARLVEHHIENRCRHDGRRAARAGGRGRPAVRRDAIDAENRVVGFEEKPQHPKSIPGDPAHALASMGIYVFTARFLFEQLCLDATRHAQPARFRPQHHPLGDPTHRVFAYPFMDENRKKDAYWRDVGTLDAYYEANMDLVSVDPLLNMYDQRLADPHLSAEPAAAEVRLCRERPGGPRAARRWTASSARASIVSGGQVERSIVGLQQPHQQLRAGGRFDPLRGRERRPARQDPPGDHRQGRAHSAGHRDRLRPRTRPRRGFTVTENGITVIAKTHGVEQFVGKERG